MRCDCNNGFRRVTPRPTKTLTRHERRLPDGNILQYGIGALAPCHIFELCTDCGGTSVAHCCEGMREGS